MNGCRVRISRWKHYRSRPFDVIVDLIVLGPKLDFEFCARQPRATRGFYTVCHKSQERTKLNSGRSLVGRFGGNWAMYGGGPARILRPPVPCVSPRFFTARVPVTLVGHSFIRNLTDAINARPVQITRLAPNFGLDQVHVSSVCRGGWKILNVSEAVRLSPESFKGIVIIQIGGNDIYCDGIIQEGQSLVSQLLDLAYTISILPRVQLVFVCQLFCRRASRYLPPNLVDSYNRTVASVNLILKQRLQRGRPGCFFWRHRGASDTSFLQHDGSHLGRDGLRKFYNSLRGAILVGLKRRSPQGSLCCNYKLFTNLFICFYSLSPFLSFLIFFCFYNTL